MLNNKNNLLTKSISILVILFLISTILTPIASSLDIRKTEESTENSTIFSKIRQKTENSKEKINHINSKTNTFQQTKTIITQNIEETLSNLNTLTSLLTGKYTINFHTKYKIYKTDNPIKLFGKTKVDVDNDGDEDISASLKIYPSLVKQPLALAFNFNLKVERLNSLIDNDAYFESYAELYMPGTLFSQNKGDRIRFGYHSERGQTVPDDCSVKYTFVPYIIPFLLVNRKPETILEIDPKINSQNDKINLVFSKSDIKEGNVESETKYVISLNNDISTKIYLGGTDDQEDSKLKIESTGNGKISIYNEKINSNGNVESSWGILIEETPDVLEFEYSLRKRAGGGYTFDYERITDDNPNIIFFRKNGPVSNALSSVSSMPYHYVKYLPKRCSIGTSLNLDGWVEFDSYDESIDEFGWADSLFNPKNSFYFANCPTDIKINWNLRLRSDNYFDVFIDTIGVSANLHLEDIKEGVLDVQLEAKTNLDCSIEWSMPPDGYIRFSRNRHEIDCKINYANPVLKALEVECTLPRITDDIPFEVNFNDAGSSKVKGLEIKTGVTVELQRLYLLIEDFETETHYFNKIQGEILNAVFTKGSNKDRQASLTIYPLIPDLINQFKEDFEGLIDGTFEFGPYFDSPYLRIAISKYSNLTCGSTIANIDYEKYPDFGKPTVEITHIDGIPVDEVHTISGTVEISGTASGGTTGLPVDKVMIRIDNDEFVEAQGTETWIYTWDTTKYNDSSHIIEVRSYVGEVFEKDTKIVHIDNLEDPSIEITEIDDRTPNDNMTVSGIVNIKGIAEAGYYPLDEVYFLVDATASDNTWNHIINESVDGLETWEYNWDTTDFRNGVYRVIANVFDVGGYVDHDYYYVLVDNGPENDPPTIEITNPNHHDPFSFGFIVVSDVLTIEGTAIPGNSNYPIENVQIQFNKPLYRRIGNLANMTYSESNWVNITDHNSDYSSWSYEWDTTGIPFGVYEIKVRSYNGKFYSVDDKSNTIYVLVWNMDLDDINLINNHASIDIYKGKNSIIHFSDIDINVKKEYENDISTFSISIDSIKWENSDKDAHFRFLYNPNNNSISYDKDKFGGKLEFFNVQFDGQTTKNNIEVMIRFDYLEFSSIGRHCRGFFSWNFETTPDFSAYIKVHISYGLHLKGLYARVKWGTQIFSGGAADLNLIGEKTYTLGLTIHVGDITWEIAPDWSSGWIRIGNADQTYIDFDFSKEINGQLLETSGIIIFESGHNPFLISWDGGLEEMNISVTGDLILEIINFNLIAGDMFDIDDINYDPPENSGAKFELFIDESGGKFIGQANGFKNRDTSLDIDNKVIIKKGFIAIIGEGSSWWVQYENLCPTNAIDIEIETAVNIENQVEVEYSGTLKIQWQGQFLSFINPDLKPIEYVGVTLQTDSLVEKEFSINNLKIKVETAMVNLDMVDYVGVDLNLGSFSRRISKNKGSYIHLHVINASDNYLDGSLTIGNSGTTQKQITITNLDCKINVSPYVRVELGIGAYTSENTKYVGIGFHLDTTLNFRDIVNDSAFSGSFGISYSSDGTRTLTNSYAKMILSKINAGFKFYNTGSRTTTCSDVNSDFKLNFGNIRLSEILNQQLSNVQVTGSASISGSRVISLNNINRKFVIFGGEAEYVRQTTCDFKQIMYSGSGSGSIKYSTDNLNVGINYDGVTNININNLETSNKILNGDVIVLDNSKTFSGQFDLTGSLDGGLSISEMIGVHIGFSGEFKVNNFDLLYEGNTVQFAPRMKCDYFELSGQATFNYEGTIFLGSLLRKGNVYLDIDGVLNTDNLRFSETNAPNNPYFEIVDKDWDGAATVDISWENDDDQYITIDGHTSRQTYADYEIQLFGLNFGTSKITFRQGSSYWDIHADLNLDEEYFDLDIDHQSQFEFFKCEAGDLSFKATRGNQFYGDLRAEWDGELLKPTYFKLSTQEGFHASAGNFEIYKSNGDVFSFLGTAIGLNGPASIVFDPITYDYQNKFKSLDCTLTNFNLYGGIELIGKLSFYGNLALDGTFSVDLSEQSAFLSADENCVIDFEYDGFNTHRVKTTSSNLDGTINIDWSNGLLLDIDVDQATFISTLEIEKSGVEQIKIKNLQIESTSLDFQFIDMNTFSLDIDADIHFDLIHDKDLSTNEDKLKMENIDIDGDLLIERPNSNEWYFESISGFSITDSTGSITIGGNTYTPGFTIDGDLQIVYSEELIEGELVKKVRSSSNNGITANLFHSYDSFDIDLDLSFSSGYFDFKWEIDGDQNGFLGTDSSYLTGNADIELLFDDYGIKVDISGYLDSDERRVLWYETDPPNIIPIWLHKEGDFDAGANSNIDFIDYNRQDGQNPVSYNLYPFWLDNDQPYADFTWTPETPNAGQIISFDASNSFYPDGDITRYDWKWHSSDTWHNNLGAYPTHTYSSAGDYDVTLRVWHNLKSDKKTKTVTVGTGGGGSAPYPPSQPQGPNELDVHETGTYTTIASDPDNDQIRYYYDWGDGNYEYTGWYNSGQTASLSHSWTNSNTYNIRVKAEDTTGKQSSWSIIKQVQVGYSGSHWERPTDHTPSSIWDREYDAYDDDVGYLDSSAESEEVGWNEEKWTGWIELTINPIDCSQIRFNAQYHSTYTPYARVEVYYDGSYHRIFDENDDYNNRQYETVSLPGSYQTVSKVRLQFFIKGYLGGTTTAELYDFQLYQVNC